MRSLTQNFFQSLRHPGPLRTYLDLRDQAMQHLGPRPCRGLPRNRDRHQDHLVVLVVPRMCGCDVSYQSD